MNINTIGYTSTPVHCEIFQKDSSLLVDDSQYWGRLVAVWIAVQGKHAIWHLCNHLLSTLCVEAYYLGRVYSFVSV